MDSYGGATEEPEVVRHEQYYFSFIVLRVENCLFKLPRHFIEQSEVFQGMCDVARADTEEGTCDQRPIYLAHTTRQDFEAFLKVAYPMTEDSRDALSCEEWLAVLEMAHKWDFNKARRLAIVAIDEFPMDEVQKIKLIQKYDIKEWTYAAYQKLMVRESSLTANEMKSLGFEFSSKIADAREKFRMKDNASSQTCSWCGNSGYLHSVHSNKRRGSDGHADEAAVREVINAVFGNPVVIL